MTPEILAILITVRQANQAVSQVNAVRKQLRLTIEDVQALKSAMVGLALVLGTALVALRAFGQDEAMRLQLEAITHSAQTAWSQIHAIRAESERGLFSKQELFTARKLFDEVGGSIKELLPISEQLALRTNSGLEASARAVASLSGGGMGRMQALLKQAGISVRELRSAGLAITDTYQIKGTPQQVLASLKVVLGKTDLLGALGDSVDAKTKGLAASIKDLFRSIGEGIAPIAKPALSFLTGMIKTITYLNDLTHGWISNVFLLVNAWMSIQKVVAVMRNLYLVEKLAAYWSAILAALNGGWGKIAQLIGLVATAFRTMTAAEMLAATWAAILDALDGQWQNLAMGAAVAAGLGIAWHVATVTPDEEDGPNAAERPVRRSDTENQFSRTRARAFA